MIAQAYKSRTTKDKLDTNIPLSVQPWGRDGEKRRYWLIEGQNDTHFRVYREGKAHTPKATWWSVAGSIDELKVLAKVLEEEDGHREAKALSERMNNAVPRFEASEMVGATTLDLEHCTDDYVEAQAPRVPCQPHRRLHTARAWLLALRGPHARQTPTIHVRRRRRLRLRRCSRAPIGKAVWTRLVTPTLRAYCHRQRTAGQISRDRYIRRDASQRPNNRSCVSRYWRLRTV